MKQGRILYCLFLGLLQNSDVVDVLVFSTHLHPVMSKLSQKYWLIFIWKRIVSFILPNEYSNYSSVQGVKGQMK